jgi:aspartyl aminopeptidase
MFDARDRLQSHLVHLKDFPIIIPQLALHLDRAAQETGLKINKQDHLQAIAAIQPIPELLKSLLKKEFRFEEIASCDLFLVPLEAPRRLGGAGELVASYRLDNLTSAYASLVALVNASAPDETLQMAIFWDHEEVGSNTATGAGSPFLDHLLERICLQIDMGREEFLQLKSHSLCISVDLAHGFHPSYSDKYDPSHAPLLGKGVVLKQNANQRYATSAESAACVMQTARKKKIALQSFVSRSDIPSGSTVGPIMAARCGINCVDLGIAGWAMHSAREVVSWYDEETLCNLLEALLEPL